MEWLEIIKVSSPADGREKLEGEIRRILPRPDSDGLHDIRVFQNAATGDSEIHLYWNSGKAEPDGSAIGLCLVHILKELGMISHSVWIEWERPGHNGKGGPRNDRQTQKTARLSN